jgi:hypothetical protein
MPATLRVSWVLLLSGGALNSSCDRNERQAVPGPPAVVPDDSLALRRADGLEIWFTLSRPARSPRGQPCRERGLEIRHGGRRAPVPLLYTGETPTLLNDSTMRAVLWTDCQPTAVYRVNLRSGQPVREPEARRPGE